MSESAMPAKRLIKRFPHLLGGNAAFRAKTPAAKLKDLDSKSRKKTKGLLSFTPDVVKRYDKFSISLNSLEKEIVLVKFHMRFPSGKSEDFEYAPSKADLSKSSLSLDGFVSAYAGDLYVQGRIYYADGTVTSDAVKTLVLSKNPDQLVITPREYLISGTAGKVEYDWDQQEFHCRANATITNGSSVSRTYNRCSVRVTDGGENGTLITSFSFNVGPFTVGAGNVSYRTVDTWFSQGSSVWSKFNARWDLTFKFTYESTSGVNVSDTAAYRPMTTIPINVIDTESFTGDQNTAESNAYDIACEILEDRDITLANPNWRILSNQSARDKYSVINIGWQNNYWDFGEAGEMYQEISGPDGDRLDLFIPLSFAYDSDVPSDKRNVGGFSTVNGPFPKDDDSQRSGCLVLMSETDHNFFGVAIAHEICHYLGLEHVDPDDNLMHKNGGLTDHKLTRDQYNAAKAHGMAKWLAPDI